MCCADYGYSYAERVHLFIKMSLHCSSLQLIEWRTFGTSWISRNKNKKIDPFTNKRWLYSEKFNAESMQSLNSRPLKQKIKPFL
jgi:hypothetical protein